MFIEKYLERQQQLLTNKYLFSDNRNLLEQQIKKIKDEKFIEINHLRHQLSLYQKLSISPCDVPPYRERDFSRARQPNKKYAKKYETYVTEDDHLMQMGMAVDFNK